MKKNRNRLGGSKLSKKDQLQTSRIMIRGTGQRISIKVDANAENQGRFFRKDFTTLPGVYGASEDAVDLLDKFLHFDPNKRITCEEALQHHYFTTAQPRPSKPSDLPIPVPFELREGGAISNRNNNMNNNNNNNNNQQQQQQMMMMDDSGSNNDNNDGVSRSLGF